MIGIHLLLIICLSASVSAPNPLKILENKFQIGPKDLGNYFNKDEGNVEISNNYLQLFCTGDFTTKNISVACANQMQAVCDNGEILSEMADAWSKLPYSGMIRSTRQDWGAFDQCIRIDYRPSEGPRVLGKYCLAGLAIPSKIKTNLTINDLYMLSYCVPDSCTASDLANLIINDLNLPNQIVSIISNLINDKYCTTKESDSTMDTSGIIVATIFGLLLLIALLATALDIILYNRQQKNKFPILTAFSLFTNGRKLAQITQGNGTGEQILVIHGLKVISMMWVVAGHAAGGFLGLPIFNQEDRAQFATKSYSAYLQSAFLAVDTFFFISGFLLAFQYFKATAKKPVMVQLVSLPGMALHRYLRVTPVVLMFYLFATFLMKYIGTGPAKPLIDNMYTGTCKEHWWTVFLYIQNYYNPKDMCWIHLWYLSADWQLFLIALVIMVAMAWQLKRNFHHLMVAMAVLNGLFLLLPVFIKLQYPDYDSKNDEYDTHSKLVTYFMGVMFGCYLRTKKDKPYLFRKGWNAPIWALSLLTLLACTIVLNEVTMKNDTQLSRALLVLVKPFWCLGLGFIIYSCSYGYGGIVNWFLTAGWIQVISRLTFCMYIMHFPMILFWVISKRGRGDSFSDFTLFHYFCGHFILSIFVSTLWTLMFESPFIAIERLVFGSGGRQPRQEGKLDKNGTKGSAPSPPQLEKISIVHKRPMDEN